MQPKHLPVALAVAIAGAPAWSNTVYLNRTNIDVAIDAATSPGDFNNTFASGATIGKVIDAPSADAEEFHSQATHIWFTADEAGGGLALRFDFRTAYDVSTLHFWNYTGESYDVDDIAFSFYDGSNRLVGALSVRPDLGTSPGIRAQDIELAAPLNVRYVDAFLSGTNRQVDFQNIGFTAQVSAVPEPAGAASLLLGLATLAVWRRRKQPR